MSAALNRNRYTELTIYIERHSASAVTRKSMKSPLLLVTTLLLWLCPEKENVNKTIARKKAQQQAIKTMK